MTPRTLKLGLVQMSMSRDMKTNVNKAVAGITAAADKGADIVCLPELFAWRYFPAMRGNTPAATTIPGQITAQISEAAHSNGVAVVAGSVYERDGRRRYNTCVVVDGRGRMVSKYRKVHIPQDEHYYEQDYFSPGEGYKVGRTEKARVGSLVCFDQWYPEPARILKLLGAEILFYPTAIGWVKGVDPVEGDWKMAWEAVQVGHAVSNSVVVCAVNRVGTEEGTTFWGGSFVCDQFGKVLFRANDREGVYVVPCDLGLGGLVEEGWGFMRNRRKETYSRIAE